MAIASSAIPTMPFMGVRIFVAHHLPGNLLFRVVCRLGRILGEPQLLLGAAQIDSEQFEFPVGNGQFARSGFGGGRSVRRPSPPTSR